jgi:hypothetical protein
MKIFLLFTEGDSFKVIINKFYKKVSTLAVRPFVMRAFMVLSQTRKNGGYLLRLVFLISLTQNSSV